VCLKKSFHSRKGQKFFSSPPSHIEYETISHLPNNSRGQGTKRLAVEIQKTSKLRMHKTKPSLVPRPLGLGASLEQNFTVSTPVFCYNYLVWNFPPSAQNYIISKVTKRYQRTHDLSRLTEMVVSNPPAVQ